jgi:glyoxylase-like metal-dependent hydrolase (beta-lactamase superfamily II)
MQSNKGRQQMRFNFKFHNVGQGLFSSGTISGFNFIYDVGSENGLLVDLAVERLAQELSNKANRPIIDMLIISHLHEDHANGVPFLFKRNLDIHTVILPYLTPIERLIVALQATTEDEEYYNFLADPIHFLFERNVSQVVLITGGRENNDQEVNYWFGEPPPEGNIDNKPEIDINEDLPPGDDEIVKFQEGEGIEELVEKISLILDFSIEDEDVVFARQISTSAVAGKRLKGREEVH